MSEDELEAIHDASLTILEEIGMDVLLPEAREKLRGRGGGEVEGQRVRIDRGWCLDAVATRRAELHPARPQPGPQRQIGGDSIVFCSGRQRAQLLGPGTRPATGQPARTSRTSCG